MPLSPELYSPDARTRLLIVAPHPDDETIGTGELLQLVRAAGGEVRVLLLTDGDDNPWPQRWLERRLLIGDAERARWGQRRRGEVAEALRRLDVPSHALRAMGWPDMGLTGWLRQDVAGLRARLVEELAAFRPNVVVLPALADRHPDHGSAHVLMRLALAEWNAEPPLLFSYLVHGREHPQAAGIVLPDAAARHAAKLDALTAHGSQMALSAGRMRRFTDRPERYDRVVRPPPDREAGVLPWKPRGWRSRLQLTIASPDGVYSWAWKDAPLQRDGQGCYRLCDVPTAPCFARLGMDVPSPWIFDRWGWCEL